MLLITPETLKDAKKILEDVAGTTIKELNSDNNSSLRHIGNGLKNLNNNMTEVYESFERMFDFFDKVGEFFRGATYCITHPFLVLDSLQPWMMIGLLVMLVLRMLGFKVDKWFRIVFLVLIISILF